MVLLAVQVDHEAAERREMRRDAVPPGEPFGHTLDPDIDRDMPVHHLGRNAKVDPFGHGITGVVGDQHDPAGPRLSDLAIGHETHRKAPDICHQPGCSPASFAAAASRWRASS